jgi:hypothetical protein
MNHESQGHTDVSQHRSSPVSSPIVPHGTRRWRSRGLWASRYLGLKPQAVMGRAVGADGLAPRDWAGKWNLISRDPADSYPVPRRSIPVVVAFTSGSHGRRAPKARPMTAWGFNPRPQPTRFPSAKGASHDSLGFQPQDPSPPDSPAPKARPMNHRGTPLFPTPVLASLQTNRPSWNAPLALPGLWASCFLGLKPQAVMRRAVGADCPVARRWR